MATRTAQLIAQLVDRVSGPAKGMASALDGVAASSKRLGQGMASPALDKLTKDLKDAQAQAEKLAQLQARMKTLGESRGAFNTARQDVERISRELEAARKAHVAGNKESERAVRDLERAQTRARSAVRSAAGAFEAEAEAAKRLRRELTTLGVPMTSLATAQSAVAAKAQAAAAALDRQTRAEKRARAAGALAADAHEAGRPARSLGPLAGMFGGYEAASAYKQAAAFDRRLTMIGQTADASRGQIDALGGSLFKLAQETATPIDSLTGGLEALVAQGRSLKEAMDFLPSVARTAAATGSEVDDIAKSADAVSSNFGIAGKQMQAAFDIMAAGGKAGQFELKDMSRYLPSLAPAAKAVGLAGQQGLSDIVAMLQVIRKGTGSSEEAATSLTNIFQKMESEETVKRFKKMGVDLEAAMKKGRKEGRNLIEVFEEAAQKATKGDLSRLPNLIADQEFGRGIRALLTYRGEWQKLSATIRATSAGAVLRDLAQPTKDAQAAITRLENSWKAFTLTAARLGDAGGISKGLGDTSKEFDQIARALERINEAYAKGGLKGAIDQIFGDSREGQKENRKAWLEERGKQEDGRIEQLEADNKSFREKLQREGYSPESIEKTMRVREREVEKARRRRAGVEAAKKSPELADKNPLRMFQDPTAPIQGQTGPIGQGGGSRFGSAFGEAFPVDVSGRKPLPSVTPLPPRRPSDVPTIFNNLEDALGPGQTVTPKVDASQVEAVKPKADEAKAAVEGLNVTVTPNVVISSITAAEGAADRLIAKLAQAGTMATSVGNQASAALANAGAGARTGRVAQAFANSPSAGEA